MKGFENWIWLSKKDYKDNQNTCFNSHIMGADKNYTVAEFKKKYSFLKKVIKAELRFSGDTLFQLFLNDKIVATGPASVGGDFFGNEKVRDNFYSFETTLSPESNTLDFFARVQMAPVHLCDYSKGHGGFYLWATLTFEDGTTTEISTDETWLSRKNSHYTAPKKFSGKEVLNDFTFSEVVENIWQTETAPIPVCVEEEINTDEILVSPNTTETTVLEFDKIWSGFLKVEAEGEVLVKLYCREIEEEVEPEELLFSGKQEYRSFYMQSASNVMVVAENLSGSNAKVKVTYIKSHYPVLEECITTTSDLDLNTVLETCKHTLKICRQTHHLDSPRHCEPLACTGDYYIESLMTPFSFGDMKLAEFDLVRTAVMLEKENGRIFHTTYSLIWVRMLYDVYMFTGNIELLKQCQKALDLLLARFECYIGENGLIENPPDYMFVDWIYIDGISMHHPPKALGQSCLNMFYFGALKFAEKIYNALSLDASAKGCKTKKELLRTAINTHLFDQDRKCYFEGLNTPTREDLLGEWMPQNVEKRYYLEHSNILAAYFGVCDNKTAKNLIDRIMVGEIGNGCQPYFLHYLLEAIYRLGLQEKYTLEIIEKWKAPVNECSKGLVEGFITPEPTYSFDHSHAWGGTPLYSLPKALLGLEILEAGMKKISISPTLLGLKFARVELLTPFGKFVCLQNKGQNPEITAPNEITVIKG